MRVGISYYVNAAPLSRGLAQCCDVEVMRGTPAKLSELMRGKEIDAALVGASEYFTGNYLILPGGAISAADEGADAVLCSSVPLNRIRRIALSTASSTTNLMLRALMQRLRPGAAIKYEYRPADACRSLQECDSCLLIGDDAVQYSHAGAFNYDLATIWRSVIGTRMVFSLWLLQRDASPQLALSLHDAIERGRKEIDQIVQEEAEARNWPVETTRRYLNQSLDFGWSQEHELALTALGQALYDADLISSTLAPEYADAGEAVTQEDSSQAT